MNDTPPISRIVSAASVPATGLEIEIAAGAPERVALAEALGLVAVNAFSAELAVTRWRGEGLRVEGRVTAEIVQSCVVTLEPVTQQIDEVVADRFLPEDDPRLPTIAAEALLDAAGEDPPEPLAGGALDLGALAIEHFALGIDPYPRAPGAELGAELPTGGDDDGDESPFAVLARLRNQPPGQG